MKNLVRTIASFSLVATGTLSAQTFSGSTQGCFYVSAAGSAGACSPTTNASLAGTGLSFAGTNFSVSGSSPLNLSSLGLFTVEKATSSTSLNAAPANQRFNLVISFTAPAGTTPNPETYFATVAGEFESNGDVMTINFDNAAHPFTFTGGAFTLQLNNDIVFSKSGNSAQTLQANVQGTIAYQSNPSTTVPEPGTYALMAAGLAAMGLVVRRRRTA